MKRRAVSIGLFFLTLAAASGCGMGLCIEHSLCTGISGSASDPAEAVDPLLQWAWRGGSQVKSQSGVYGVQGVASPTNFPGARYEAMTWIDGAGNLWLFGGVGNDSAGTSGYLNDLWKYDGENWTWVKGSDTISALGVHGTPGVGAPSSSPGARRSGAAWVGADGKLWLFGGYGCSASSCLVRLSDIWKFDGTNWVWIEGPSGHNEVPVFGAQGVTNGTNTPGGRMISCSTGDPSGNVWLFGGSIATGNTSDFWKYDGTDWTWMAGSNLVNQSGIYGTKGVAAGGNVPGGRNRCKLFHDSTGVFWLFSGTGLDSVGASGLLSDLWKWNGSQWTWISGDNTVESPSVHGTLGVAAATNQPGGRSASMGWIDAQDQIWIFGGTGIDEALNGDEMSDFYRWDGTAWTWMAGPKESFGYGAYGTLNVASPNVTPGSRRYGATWMDAEGNFFLFGGFGNDGSTIGQNNLNDFWEFVWY